MAGTTVTPEKAEQQCRKALQDGIVVAHGPTWQLNERGVPILPEKTIGYQAIKWAETNLRLKGEALLLTQEQKRFILWWYAVDREGDFSYRSGCLQRLKGWG